MNELQESVQVLITEACSYSEGSPQRQRCLTKIIRLISSHLWWESTPYYQDALQQTWIYFCQNLCEGRTGCAYDTSRGNVITWLNSYLKRRLQDGYLEVQQQAQTIQLLSAGTQLDSKQWMVDRLPAKPDIPPLLEEVAAWAVQAGNSRLKTTHIANHPEVTCQLLILRRLPPETAWRVLATELGVAATTLSSFYQRHCLPLLRDFGQSQGYL